jgi:hypothetical protein
MGLIWTIGYQRLEPERLRCLAVELDALVIDTRHVPKTRIKGYGPKQLETLLGWRYRWAGNELGGRGHVTPSGIAALKSVSRNVLLMCVCHAPGDCHRHQDICGPHFPDALHICEDEVVTAAELERSIRQDTDYECTYLDDVISRSNSSPD